MKVSRRRFEALVHEALRTIPARFREEMRNVAVVIEEEPEPELLAEMGIEPPDSLYGLYQGIPLTERSWSDGQSLPDRVVLYRGPITEDAEDEDDLMVIVAETVIHEFGHYFGLSEDEIEDIEEAYWRGEGS
jgi:predicted Zn-dependent protease with MMP-like domain